MGAIRSARAPMQGMRDLGANGSRSAFLCLQEAMKLPKSTPEEQER